MRVCQFRHFGIERRWTTAQRGDGKRLFYCNGSVEAVKRGAISNLQLANSSANAGPQQFLSGAGFSLANCELLFAIC